ncbi:MAG TPA: FHA domain-containing protein [Candidatus Angelobacter sp.]|nr:FHA domain-containing protein [Candidatus Angelobacter sp.]
MPNTDDKPALKITLEDLAKVEVRGESPAGAMAATATGAKQYGNIASPGDAPALETQDKPSIFLQGWFYLGAAGLIGALIGWGLCEPFFIDSATRQFTWAEFLMLPAIIMFTCLGLGVAESIVERSAKKALIRGLLGLALGAVFGFIFDRVANIVYAIGGGIIYELGVRTAHNPAQWMRRGIAWAVFGVAGGIVYGLVDRSGRKTKYGILGGLIGAGLGGTVFDPISFATNTGSVSRGVGFGLLGLATGVAIGIVESALKDRWLYVASGPLAGKQFILYKPITTIGSSQKCDIYLFKDNTILPQHGVIEMRGAQTFLRSDGQIFVSGQPARMRALQSGDLIQIGRYAFHFRERHRN